MTLKEAECGDVVVIKNFSEEEEILKKIAAMGLRKGSQFEVLRKCGRNILIKNGLNRLIISKDLAEKISVELIKRSPESCQEISCELIDKACPEEGKALRKRKRWGLLHRLCPFLKD
jgi:Fe2+ transport system protein FeoA